MLVHGHCGKDYRARSKTYISWMQMKQRCYNKKHAKFNNYGGRGIKVCKRWSVFTNFLLDMGERPPGLTLDRRNPNKHYCKSNCKWSDIIEQRRNQRRYGK